MEIINKERSSQAVLDVLAKEFAPIVEQINAERWGIKHDASGSPITAGYSHGPGGLLTFPGVDPIVFNSAMGNKSFLGQLPTKTSVDTNPVYTTMTGVQDDSGSEKNEECDNAPVAGLMKACLTTAVFGRYERATKELEVNRLGQRINRGDPMDLRLVGSPIHGSGIFASGARDPSTPADLFSNEVSRKFWELNIALHRLISRQLWQGNPTNNTAGGGYKEMTGLQVLVNTGYRDAETGVVCPSVDSYLPNFNFGRVDQQGGATNIVRSLTDAFYQLRDRAERMGLDPVRWVIVMRPQLFYELTAVWPCSYLTYRCLLQGNERVNIDANDQVAMRDSMRAGNYLLIDGERVDVIKDDGILELNTGTSASVPSGCFASDIYIIPMSVIGGQAVTFIEYFDYTNPSITEAINNMFLGRVEGAFLTWPRQTNQCIVWQTKTEPRIVLRTPFLAARVRNVVYCPLQHTRDTFPEDPYHVDGGQTQRLPLSGPSLYAVWKQ